jgi:hypothetical protein
MLISPDLAIGSKFLTGNPVRSFHSSVVNVRRARTIRRETQLMLGRSVLILVKGATRFNGRIS